jgi:hypothetical protein
MIVAVFGSIFIGQVGWLIMGVSAFRCEVRPNNRRLFRLRNNSMEQARPAGL